METHPILRWKPLVLKMVRQYEACMKANREEYADVIQAGLLGVILADKEWKEECGYTFMCYATVRIRSEIQKLLFSDVNSNTFRNKEAPISPEMLVVLKEQRNDIPYGDYESYQWVDIHRFVSSLPLSNTDKRFLTNMIEHGVKVASGMFRDESGLTRQGMYLRRKKIREVAQCYLT